MCLIGIGWHAHPRYALVVAANRDEFRARPTRAARFWPEHADILAGRDGLLGGTWLGLTRRGRFAAVTNFREATPAHAGRSRGGLVVDCLLNGAPLHGKDEYAGYNLLWADLIEHTMFFDSNRMGYERIALEPGVFGMSNGAFDKVWPKTASIQGRLGALLGEDDITPDALCVALFEALLERHAFPDEDLPDSGVGLPRERMLSPVFIDSPEYGTRSSTVVIVDVKGEVYFEERSFDAPGNIVREQFNYLARSGA